MFPYILAAIVAVVGYVAGVAYPLAFVKKLISKVEADFEKKSTTTVTVPAGHTITVTPPVPVVTTTVVAPAKS